MRKDRPWRHCPSNLRLFVVFLIHHRIHWLLGAVLLGLFLAACEQPSQLSRIQSSGELLVGTRLASTTYYQGATGPDGLEHALVIKFAEHIGVTPRFVFPGDINDLLRATRNGVVHMAAAGLTITPQRQRTLRFSQPYQQVEEQVVYRRGSRKPRSIEQIPSGQLHVIGNSSHVETLANLRRDYPMLEWTARYGVSQNTLFEEVNSGEIALTVSDSHELARVQRMHPYLTPALTIGESQSLAWAFPSAGDGSLLNAANEFLSKIRDDGTLKLLLERYYGHTERMNFVDRRDFRRHTQERLPRFRKFFKQAAARTGYDWRLLAAIGYQESHWRPDAISPTGVRGLMMLTQATARRVGVKKRTDPKQSILGGADYLKIIEAKIPKRIPKPDRTWLALAGYNVGFGHLEGARILTERFGGNPDRWMDVKKHLPLLQEKEHYQTLPNGFARGNEPVTYVENIRNYYELLVWYDRNPDALL